MRSNNHYTQHNTTPQQERINLKESGLVPPDIRCAPAHSAALSLPISVVVRHILNSNATNLVTGAGISEKVD